MRRGEFLGVLAAAACLVGCQVVEPVWNSFSSELGKAGDMFVKPFQSLTIMSWNIRAGLGMDDIRDISRAAAVIRSAGADVVALQEVDRNTLRSGGVDQVAELERATGMVATWCKAIDYDGGEYGVALLSRVPPLKVRRAQLPRLGQTEQRVLLVAEFPEFSVGVTHLSLDAGERIASVDVIREFASPEKPLFLAGDWNSPPRGDFFQKIRGAFAVLSGYDKTFPAPEPNVCIDYIAVSRRHRARYEHVSHEVLPETVASDHRPVVVRVR
ncbi:MAG: endonuclease/exonuclease/phosphatase family protein [Kiritimatiellia bacterium]